MSVPILVLISLDFASGSDNGRATRPLMGWRCWNQYQGRISQLIMEDSFRALASQTLFPSVDGVQTSLSDLGYSDAGLDDGWQLCGDHGPNHYTYHTEAGSPVIDTTKFPNMTAMNHLAHNLNLTSGWYGNNCNCGPTPRNGCADTCTSLECYAGDVSATLALGFDSIKLDGCGAQRDIKLWDEMFNHSITVWNLQNPHAKKLPMLLENCHDGMSVAPPQGHAGDPGNIPHRDAQGELWCPFHMYRSGGDNRPVWGSVLSHLDAVVQLADKNLSVPGCWAYPDMLEVGVTNAQLPMPGHKLNCGPSLEDPCPPLTVTEARSHFGAWSIISSPLVLGMNLSDVEMVEKHWATITNRDAIEVNQDYAGFSGSRFAQSEENSTFTPCDWGLQPNSNNASCVLASSWSWYKPLSGRDVRGSTMAVLLMNNGGSPRALSFQFGQVRGMETITKGCQLYNVWSRERIGLSGPEGWASLDPIEAHDSVFLTLSQCT